MNKVSADIDSGHRAILFASFSIPVVSQAEVKPWFRGRPDHHPDGRRPGALRPADRVVQSSLQHFARRQLRQVLGNVNPAGVELEQLDMFFGLASAQDQPQRRLLAGPRLVLLKPAEILARQGSSACCCILTRRASEGSASEPALARRKICEI